MLATEMGKAYMRGLQGNDIGAKDKVAACLKHYAGYSLPMNGQDRTPAWIDERTLRQYVLPTFEAGVKASVATVMLNSGEINGVPGHANDHLLTEILKQEWGFKGFVVSDWADVKRLHTRDRVADSPKAAVRMAVMAGVDMSMVPMDYSFYDAVLQSIHDNTTDATVILAASPFLVDGDAELIRGKRVLAIEDGPTLTHGEMTYGAAALAAKANGAAELIDPRSAAVGSIAETFRQYPHVGTLLPAMGYGKQQMDDLRATIEGSGAELVLIGTPIDLRRLIDFQVPALRITYRLQEVGEPTLRDVLAEHGLIGDEALV